MIAYFDCFSGISGDMALGALVDAGADAEEISRQLATLPLSGYQFRAEKTSRQGISGTQARVTVDPEVEQPHRHLRDILAMVDSSDLDEGIKVKVSRVFHLLGEAEALVHGVTVDQVHFHEVGAVDAIVDVVGTVVGLQLIGIQQLYASPLPTGRGMIASAHGTIPVPAPATVQIAVAAGIPLKVVDVETELVTPTGAALLAALASFDNPEMVLRSVGYGFGTAQLPWPNAARLWVGESAGDA